MRVLKPEDCMPIWQAVGFEPTGPEQAAFLYGRDRFPMVVGGERGGKSTTVVAKLAPHVLMLPRVSPDWHQGKEANYADPDFVIFGPTYVEPRVEYRMLYELLDKLGMLDKDRCREPVKAESWSLVTKDGVVVQTRTTVNAEAIRAISPEGILVVEAGGVSLDAIQRIRGRVTTSRGFVFYSGTLENSNPWYSDWLKEGERPNLKGVKTYSIPSWTNRVEFPGGMEDPEIISWRNTLGEELFQERVAAKPVPPRGRVINEFKADHILDMEPPEGARHELWIDPGYASAYAILFVAIWEEDDGLYFHVYDEFYEQQKTTEQMVTLVQAHPAWKDLVKTRKIVIDIASKGHRDSTTSSLEIWKKRLPQFHCNMKYWNEDRLIERIRHTFQFDRISVSPKCMGLIAEAGLGEKPLPEMHEWRYLQDRSHNIISEKPVDRWNHSFKALGYGLLDNLGQIELPKKKPKVINRLKKRSRN